MKFYSSTCAVGVIFVLSLLSTVSCTPDASQDDKQIDADIQRFIPGSKTYDVDFAIDHTYKPLFDAGGVTRDRMKVVAAEEMQKMWANRVKIASVQAVLPYQHFSTSVNDYALIELHEGLWKGLDYYKITDWTLAVRPHGTKSWEYLSASGLAPDLKARLFPDLKDREFPARTIEKVM